MAARCAEAGRTPLVEAFFLDESAPLAEIIHPDGAAPREPTAIRVTEN
ncbi:hypothetical protein ACFXKS_01955 [Streptomyces scopuliridis]